MASRHNSNPATASPPQLGAGWSRDGERSPLTERDELYRDNQRHRKHPVRLNSGEWDETTLVSVLGLEQMTISRLYRAGIDRLARLLEVPVEELWRSIGRQGITDIIRCLEYQGLALHPRTDYEKWRLGMVDLNQIMLAVTSDSPVADLWPMLGLALTKLLQKRGRVSVADLVPRDEDDLLQLYRLGKGNLRQIQSVLGQLAPEAEGEWRNHIDRAMRMIAKHSVVRTSRRGRSARREPADMAPSRV